MAGKLYVPAAGGGGNGGYNVFAPPEKK